ncbi:hypothetical protein BS47DRAFT_1371302 [Hydnum rufescens UP504]|uniref:Transcription activator of gluconeogenesis ERT1 n=1 Tax=Hydnum rufescens UP504 TaxID=1448309 RepID=A0A9P6B5B5_9AGAM|nr:hypothetical protein BS47DRAFT_1371302 [Hydnum rufescens UP504]
MDMLRAPLPPDSRLFTAPDRLDMNAQAGPSKKAPRRKRNYIPSNTPPPEAVVNPPPSDSDGQTKPPKKKKASRACAHCQKAHLTCDDSRPCQRCLKRGMADSCVEGQRKKAKYLLDVEELGKFFWIVKPEDGSAPEEQIPNHEPDSLFNLAFDPSYPFGSQTANLEYSILSAILGNPGLESQPSIGDLNSPLQASTLRTQGPPSPPPSNGSPDFSIMPKDTSAGSRLPKTYPGDRVYSSVQKGYDYTQGYHFLMRYLSERFEKNDILRVVRALAIFRPSIIALQMPMSEKDEKFAEKALQRSLLELEKLISFSGTPTAIWRRTGEICVVGLEFTMLTGWSREELVEQRKFIYELFENQSTVEYWENFASHAFENTTQSVYSHCVLLKPSGEPVSCAFCFTIRRDMFSLPNLIIGQWLPLF